MSQGHPLDRPLAEVANATCRDCHWTASGPWSHRAAEEHAGLEGHHVDLHPQWIGRAWRRST